jgi:hypothetical protein
MAPWRAIIKSMKNRWLDALVYLRSSSGLDGSVWPCRTAGGRTVSTPSAMHLSFVAGYYLSSTRILWFVVVAFEFEECAWFVSVDCSILTCDVRCDLALLQSALSNVKYHLCQSSQIVGVQPARYSRPWVKHLPMLSLCVFLSPIYVRLPLDPCSPNVFWKTNYDFCPEHSCAKGF